MARLTPYEASVGLSDPGVANTDMGGARALGSAITGVGNAITAYQAEIQRRREERENFKTTSDYNAMRLRLADQLETTAANAPNDGAGLHADFMAKVYKPERDTFLKSVPERLRPKYEAILSDGAADGMPGQDHEEWSLKAAGAERMRVQDWARTEIGAQTDTIAKAIALDPDGYDDFLRSGNELIDSAPLPAAEKQKLRANWERTAQIAHLNKMLENDPEGVLKSLGADPSRLSTTTKFGILTRAIEAVETGGHPDPENAVSPAGALGKRQVMPNTARDIARWMKDPDFPTNGDTFEIAEYITRPYVNRRYSDFYLKKLMKDFGGDLDAVLIGYHGGPENAKAWLKANRDDSVLPEKTRQYYHKVKEQMFDVPAAAGPRGSDVQFVWVRDGGAEVMGPEDPRIASTNRELRNRVSEAYAAVGIGKVRVRSAKRDPKHNEDVGGAKQSQHLPGNALDLDVSGMPVAQRVQLIDALSAAGVTGIGVYANTIHADLGTRRAWGPDYSTKSLPKWASTAIERHLSNTAKPQVSAGRYSSLPYEDRERFITSADRAVSAIETEKVKVSADIKVAAEQMVRNELASIERSGESAGADDKVILEALGEERFLEYKQRAVEAGQRFAARDGLIQMDDEAMADRLSLLEPDPGSPTYAADQKTYDAAYKEVERVKKLRASDPSLASLQFPEVRAAYDAMTANRTAETIQAFIKASMARQQMFNAKATAPVPREWAMAIGASIGSRVPEMSGKNLAEVKNSFYVIYQALQEQYGDMTDEVIIYALSVYHGVGPNTAELLEGYMKAIAAGGDPFKKAAPAEAVESDGWFDWLFGSDSATEEARRNAEKAVNPDGGTVSP